jgi:hypothetical protein
MGLVPVAQKVAGGLVARRRVLLSIDAELAGWFSWRLGEQLSMQHEASRR